MNDAAYYAAATAQLSSRSILGLTLKPFSAGHLIHLHNLSSPFVSEGEADYGALAVAVFICSQTFEDALLSLADPDLPEFMRRWQRSLCGQTGWRYRFGLSRPRPIDLKAGCESMREYMQEGWKHPDWIADEDGGRTLGCPLVQAVKVTLMSRMGFSETQFLNRSWSLSLWDYLTLKEFDDQVRLIDHEVFIAGQADADEFDQAVRSGRINGL